MDLTGQTVVVTGGARGLGYSLAEAYASAGAQVALLDILDSVDESASRLATEFGVRTTAVTTDVTDQDAVEAAFERVTNKLGVPTLLLTAAGITVWNDSVDVSAAEWRKVMSVNLDGTFLRRAVFRTSTVGESAEGQRGLHLFDVGVDRECSPVPGVLQRVESSSRTPREVARGRVGTKGDPCQRDLSRILLV